MVVVGVRRMGVVAEVLLVVLVQHLVRLIFLSLLLTSFALLNLINLDFHSCLDQLEAAAVSAAPH